MTLVDINFTLVLSVVGVGALLAALIKVGELHSAHKAHRRAASVISELKSRSKPASTLESKQHE